jgi:hypothetical protein
MNRGFVGLEGTNVVGDSSVGNSILFQENTHCLVA